MSTDVTEDDLNEEQFNPPDTLEVEEASDQIGEEYYPVEYSISSYGADYPVDGLVKRIDAGSIYIPKFQRSFVWNVYRASRFIESLLLGLPVPAVFLSRELDSNKMLVIDGQQRLRTLQYFYNGIFEPTDGLFRLRGVHERYQQKTYETLSEDDRLRLDDSIIHAIIVKQESPDDGENATSPSSAYHIFERLNTGGVLLQPQEIRSCIYHGALVELLETLNMDQSWRVLFGNISSRMRDRELILRFLALYRHSDQYSKPMKEFLNYFAAKYRKLDEPTAQHFRNVFCSTVSLVLSAIGDRAFKTKTAINAALFDSVTVGIARRLDLRPVTNESELKAKYDHLLQDEEFKDAISSGTTDEANVKSRLSKATDAFRDVP